jgi:hypothetical protein
MVGSALSSSQLQGVLGRTHGLQGEHVIIQGLFPAGLTMLTVSTTEILKVPGTALSQVASLHLATEHSLTESDQGHLTHTFISRSWPIS